MVVQDIIEKGEKDIPVSESFIDDVNDEDDFPVVYSDSSSDTANISDVIEEFISSSFDEGDATNFIDDVNWINDSNNFTDDSFNFADETQHDMDMLVIVDLGPERSAYDNEIDKMQTNNMLSKIKNISVKSKANMGKRKARRYENSRQLDLLMKDTGMEDLEVDDLMPFNCTFRFTQILQDHDLSNKILNPMINTLDEDDIVKRNNKKRSSSSQKKKKITASAAFNNLDSSEKIFFKRRNLPMGMVQYLDSSVFSFFQNDPTGTYISEPLSSYERMMLHGIAHYYRLNSISYNTDLQDVRLTKVTNSNSDFNPPGVCLSEYLEQEMQKSTNRFEINEKRGRFTRRQYVRTR